MHHFRSIRRLALGAALAGAAIGAVPAMASAASTCTYDPTTRTVTVTDGSGDAPVRVVRTGVFITVADGDAAAKPCSAGNFRFATIANTDLIAVNESLTSDFDGVTLDESAGEFAPGSTPEADGHSEIEIAVSKVGGAPGNGNLKIIGTPGNDVIRIARGAISLDLDDDVDLRHPAGHIAVLGGQGSDFLSGQAFSGRLPTLSSLGLSGGSEDDTLIGGTQGDFLAGDGDNDTLRSVDGATDNVNGGPGFDNAIHDSLDHLSQIESEVTVS